MRQHHADITATFTDRWMAGRFAMHCRADGYPGERDGETVVTVTVNSDRDERIVLGLAEEFKGTAKVLADAV